MRSGEPRYHAEFLPGKDWPSKGVRALLEGERVIRGRRRCLVVAFLPSLGWRMPLRMQDDRACLSDETRDLQSYSSRRDRVCQNRQNYKDSCGRRAFPSFATWLVDSGTKPKDSNNKNNKKLYNKGCLNEL